MNNQSQFQLFLYHMSFQVFISQLERLHFRMSLSPRKISMFLSQVQGQKLTKNAQGKIMMCF